MDNQNLTFLLSASSFLGLAELVNLLFSVDPTLSSSVVSAVLSQS